MRKYLFPLALLLLQLSAYSQKIPPSKKEQLFKTPAYWKMISDDKLKTAPPDVLAKINAMNAEGVKKKYTFKVGYTSVLNANIKDVTGFIPPDTKNKLTLYPPEQFKTMQGQPQRIMITATANDRRVDMRDYNIITPVRNQGNCGSCWDFASVSALETAFLLKNGGEPSALDLSEQQILNCTDWTNSCGGGRQHLVFQHMCDHNIQEETPFPYISIKSNCENENAIATNYKGRRWGWVGDPVGGATTIQQIKQAIIEHGSVTSSVCATPTFMGLNSDDVYNANDGNCGLVPNHVVVIIGWDDDKQAWLIKNSWGDRNWGFGGFAWILYNTNWIGGWATWIEAEPATPATRTEVLQLMADYNTSSASVLELLINPSTFYRLQSVKNWTGDAVLRAGMVIDLNDPVIGNPDKGRKVLQWSSHGQIALGSDGHNQEWWFIPSGQRNNKPVYKIFNNGFNNFLTDNNSGSPICENGTGNTNQLWELIPSGETNCFFIRNVATTKCVQVPGNMNEGSALVMATMNMDNTEGRNDDQKFRLLREPAPILNNNITAADWVKLVPHHAGDKALDLSAGSTNDVTQVQIWQWINGNPNQLWQLTRDGQFYSIRSRASNKCMEVYGFSADNGGNVVSWSCLSGRNQQWIVIECMRDRGKYVLFNRNSGKCLDVSGAGRTDGTHVHQWDFVNANNQKWRIEKVN
jgi:cathepsin L